MTKRATTFVTAGVIAVCTLICDRAQASLAPVAPFQGSVSESWEEFTTNFGEEGTHLSSPAIILDGIGLISNPYLFIYEPGVSEFYLGSSGTAQVGDGMKAMGLDFGSGASTATIECMVPVTSFGAYWGAGTSQQPLIGDPAMISVSFYDVNDSLIGTEVFAYSRSSQGADGLLEWHGWSSDVPVKRITYTEDAVVIDGLQANPVPEPATLALLTSSLLFRRRHR